MTAAFYTAPAYVYLLRCADASLYIGYTLDLPHRLWMHQSGQGGKYTRAHRPIHLALAIACPNATTARRLEARLKRLRHAEREALLKEAPSCAVLLRRFWPEGPPGAPE